MESWEKLGKPVRGRGKERRASVKEKTSCGSAENYIDFTVGGNKHLDVILNGALEEIRILGLIVSPDNTAEVAFQLRMSRNRVKNLVSLLSSWLKLAEKK